MWNELSTFLQHSFRNTAHSRQLDLRGRLFSVIACDRHDALRHDIIHRIFILNGSRITVEGLAR